MKSFIITGLLVLAVVTAQEYRISSATNALQNAEKNNHELNNKLTGLLSDNASIYSELQRARSQVDALGKAHILARQQLQRAERHHAESMHKLAEYRKSQAYSDWADTALPDAAEHWLRQLSTSHQPSHRVPAARYATAGTDSAVTSTGYSSGTNQQ